jgi:hypothetical protein
MFILFAIATTLYSQEIPRLYRSAHYALRGDTGTADADHQEAIFYNPAGLALGKGIYKKIVLVSPQVETSTATKDLAREIGAEEADAIEAMRGAIGKHQTLSTSNFTGIILRRVAIGAYVNGSVQGLVSKSAEEGGIETVSARLEQNALATLSLAERFFNEKLYIGATAKYLRRTLGEIELGISNIDDVDSISDRKDEYVGTGFGTGVDLGLMFRPSGRAPLNFGVTVHNVGNTVVIAEEKTSVDLDLKQTVDVGLSFEPRTRTSAIKVLVDVHDVTSAYDDNIYKKLHLGGELSVLGLVGVCGGVHQGYPTAGMYLDLPFFRFDFGMYTSEVGERVGTRPDTRIISRIEISL